MYPVRQYRNVLTIGAEKVEESGMFSTYDGVRFIPEGDYIVHVPGFGTKHVEAHEFDATYELVPDEEILAQQFTPQGKTVDYVVAFMRDNPQEVDRIKALESAGGKRKAILNYAS